MIKVQREDFDVGRESEVLSAACDGVGALVFFVGLVRDLNHDKKLTNLTLEHYPGMTEKELQGIELEAQKLWELGDTLIVHRYGILKPKDRIVMCAATSAHRQAAFEACQFMMDWLKTKAPFWKKEDFYNGSQWVKANRGDDVLAERWMTLTK